jgi:cytochrome b involved in lipid metabolism
MTSYAYIHPGPRQEAIHPYCGIDATTPFSSFHPPDYLADVESEIVGNWSSASRVAIVLSLVMSVVIAVVRGF